MHVDSVTPAVAREQTLPVRSDADIVTARQVVRKWAEELKFNLVEQTKIVTAASELARNTLLHGRGGSLRIERVMENSRQGLRLTFKDQGPGIPDVQRAMQDGFTTGGGLGLGLPGAKRLVSEFHLQTKVGEGTEITVVRWK